jgi:hypothetical protein
MPIIRWSRWACNRTDGHPWLLTTVQRVISAGTLPVAVSSNRPARCTRSTFAGSSALMSKRGGRDGTGSREKARNEWEKNQRSRFTAMSVVYVVVLTNQYDEDFFI